MAIGDNLFCKLWPLGQNEENQEIEIMGIPNPYYSIYEMPTGLAFS